MPDESLELNAVRVRGEQTHWEWGSQGKHQRGGERTREKF